MGTLNIFKALGPGRRNDERSTTADLLVAVASLGECSMVLRMIESGHSVHSRSTAFGRLLPAAAGSGNIELVQRLLDKGADVYTGDETSIKDEHETLIKLDYRSIQQYGSALQVASLKGHLPIVNILLEPRWRGHHCVRNRLDREDAIKAAATAGHGHVLQSLLCHAREDPRIKSLCARHETILVFAASHGHPAIVETAIKELQNDPAAFRNQFLPFKIPFKSVDKASCRFSLKEAVASAAAHGRLDVVLALLSTGDLLEYHSLPACSLVSACPEPLYHAARRGHLRVAEALLQAGANIDGVHPTISPLGGAVSTGQAHMVSWLLDNKAQLEKHDEPSQKPSASQLLRHAMEMGFDSVVDILTAYGAELDGCTEGTQCCFVDSGCNHLMRIPACYDRASEKMPKNCVSSTASPHSQPMRTQ